MTTRTMQSGGYRYIPGVMQYSAGVGALDGFTIVRECFAEPVPLRQGFEAIARRLDDLGRPRTAFCACELRSPGQFSEEAFAAFNRDYADTLRDWGIMEGDDNPIARSNVCPAFDAPEEPGFHAFCYTLPSAGAPPTFVIAGSGEAPEGQGDYASVTVRYGDTSESGLKEKAAFVLGEMERRLAFFDASWPDTTGVQLYTVFDIHSVFVGEMTARGATRNGVAWHNCRPPVIGLDFEMDCRRVLEEKVLMSGNGPE